MDRFPWRGDLNGLYCEIAMHCEHTQSNLDFKEMLLDRALDKAMKFRAVIQEQQYMKEFLNTVFTISRLTKECIMNISAETIYLIVNEETTSGAPLVWSEINCSSIFDEYIMEGVDGNHPNILLSFSPQNLARALSLLRSAVSFVKIKLTNKQFPCLTIDIELPSNASIQNRRIVHDVPVDVIPRRDWESYKLPTLPVSKIVLSMPTLRFLKNLIDKFKNLSPSITFCATSSGELSIIAETDSATVASHYRNLDVKQINRNDDSDDDDDEVNAGDNRNTDKNGSIEVSCLVDCKKTATFLQSLPMNNSEFTCGIVQDHLMQMTVEIRHGISMTSVIPAVCM